MAASLAGGPALLLVLRCAAVRAQSMHVDWSRVELGADGTATFGPTVEVDQPEPPPVADRLLGYYANRDGDFYGRPGHVEYLQVRRGDDGRLEAIKIVGDHNVPRGHLTWRSARGQADAPMWRMPIQLQLRDDITSDSAFWWSPGHVHEVEWEPSYAAFHVHGQNPSASTKARFERVAPEEALVAARTVRDAP